MNLLENLKNLGVNVDEALDRMMGNTALYERMLGKFVKMIDDTNIQPDFDENDYADLIEKAHGVKGVSGNLSLTPIYEAYSRIVSLLREDKPKEAKEILKNVQPVQKKIVDCIKSHM